MFSITAESGVVVEETEPDKINPNNSKLIFGTKSHDLLRYSENKMPKIWMGIENKKAAIRSVVQFFGRIVLFNSQEW